LLERSSGAVAPASERMDYMGYKIAVAGATGAVGREMLQTLEERNFPADEVVALASKDSVGVEVSYGDKRILKIQALDQFDFAGTDIALFSAGGLSGQRIRAKSRQAGHRGDR